jgi:hypothetical protein
MEIKPSLDPRSCAPTGAGFDPATRERGNTLSAPGLPMQGSRSNSDAGSMPGKPGGRHCRKIPASLFRPQAQGRPGSGTV